MENSSTIDPQITQMQAVTISREYGSGGGEIAGRLARMLGWRLLDHEAVVQVAQELGVGIADAEAWDEQVESLGARLLRGLSLLQPVSPNAMQSLAMPSDPIFHEAMRRVVETALTTGHVVIVGRGSQMLLHERRDIVHVRVVAPLEQRIAYVMKREELPDEDAETRIHYKDSGRGHYLREQYQQDPADPLLYDLIINTGLISLDGAVQLIRTALTDKADQLHASAGELGPGSGLARYPGHWRDFHMPFKAEGS